MNSIRTLLLVTLALLMVGCRPKPQISSYKAPKPKKTEATDRMLGAVILRGEQAWFFKMMGSTRAVSEVAEPFESLVKSVTFNEEEKPVWKLPKDWKEVPSSSTLRHATISVPSSENLEVSVSMLPAPEDAGDEYVLRNINRWRGQLQLRSLLPVELKEATEKIELADGEAMLVSILGQRKGDMGSAPFAPFAGGDRGAGPVGPAVGPSPPTDAELTYTAPEQWRKGKPGSFRKASFAAGQGDQAVEITIIELGGPAGGPLLNVNRWRTQVGLKDMTAAELEEQSQQLEIADLKGQYVELVGPKETILGVIAPMAGRTWFIKLKGDKDTAANEKQRFEEFVRSIRFEN